MLNVTAKEKKKQKTKILRQFVRSKYLALKCSLAQNRKPFERNRTTIIDVVFVDGFATRGVAFILSHETPRDDLHLIRLGSSFRFDIYFSRKTLVVETLWVRARLIFSLLQRCLWPGDKWRASQEHRSTENFAIPHHDLSPFFFRGLLLDAPGKPSAVWERKPGVFGRRFLCRVRRTPTDRKLTVDRSEIEQTLCSRDARPIDSISVHLEIAKIRWKTRRFRSWKHD